jgi:hypothetical protein
MAMETAILLILATGCGGSTDQQKRSSDPEDSGDQNDTAGADTGAPPSNDGILGHVVDCPSPRPSASWVERGASLGLTGRPDDGRTTAEATYVLVFDFNEDGYLDILQTVGAEGLASEPEPLTLFYGSRDGFVAHTFSDLIVLWQPSLGDVDGDGDLDVLLAGSDRWLRNDGENLSNQRLTGMPAEAGAFIREFEAADIDGDGHMDLFALAALPAEEEPFSRDFILWGHGDGSFTAETDSLTRDKTGGKGFDAQWVDWNGDGIQEIYVANDQGYAFTPNVLWSYSAGEWEDLAPVLHADLAHDAMGVDAGDLNGDGFPDLYLTAAVENSLLLSQTDGTFADATLSLNASPLVSADDLAPMAWAGLWVDHDNDGTLNLLVTQGYWWDALDGPRPEAPVNLLSITDGRFVDIATSVGIDARGSFRGAVAEDFNGDGIQDFLLSTLFGPPMLYLSEGCTSDTWIDVTAPPGSTVTVVADGLRRVGWVSTSSGFGSAGPPTAHFGLGTAEAIDHISVILPGGRSLRHDGPFQPRRTISFQP